MSKVKKKKYNNVKLAETTYNIIKSFCKEKGFKIGAFCEIAATEKIQKETTNGL